GGRVDQLQVEYPDEPLCDRAVWRTVRYHRRQRPLRNHAVQRTAGDRGGREQTRTNTDSLWPARSGACCRRATAGEKLRARTWPDYGEPQTGQDDRIRGGPPGSARRAALGFGTG